MLAREHWVRVPELTAGERSGLFAMEDALRLARARSSGRKLGRPKGSLGVSRLDGKEDAPSPSPAGSSSCAVA